MGPNPTDRGKPGTKTSLLVLEQGGPLGVVIDGANVPDGKRLPATIEAVVIERPEAAADAPHPLCLDKGYDNPTGRAANGRPGAARSPHRGREAAVRSDEGPQAASVGSGAHLGLVEPVSGVAGAV